MKTRVWLVEHRDKDGVWHPQLLQVFETKEEAASVRGLNPDNWRPREYVPKARKKRGKR